MTAKVPIGVAAGSILLVLVALMLTISAPQTSRAQDPISVGLVGLGAKLLVGDILDDFEEKTEKLIDRAGQRGELAIANAGSELQLLIANFKVMLADLEKKTFEGCDR